MAANGVQESAAMRKPSTLQDLVGAWARLDVRRALKRAFRMLVSSVLRCGPIPIHVAFIMDGNRRWAEKRNLDRKAGHTFGFSQLKDCLKWCLDLGVTVVTVYAFSIENFKRPQSEVDSLMCLAADKLDELVCEHGFLEKNQIRVQVLGDLALLPERVQRAASRAMRLSKHHKRAILNICLSYTSRQEMHCASVEMLRGVAQGVILPCDVTESLVGASLYTAPHSQVDMLVRSSGETRMSDFMLWQSAFAFLSFQDVLWPDFSLWNLAWSVVGYQRAYAKLRDARARHAQQMEAREALFDANDMGFRLDAASGEGSRASSRRPSGASWAGSSVQEDVPSGREERLLQFMKGLERRRKMFLYKFVQSEAPDAELQGYCSPVAAAHKGKNSSRSSLEFPTSAVAPARPRWHAKALLFGAEACALGVMWLWGVGVLRVGLKRS
mmetsp:Transcript_65718/g.161806  ORF Transcript_65718/g.161806 Transcript_65718/m.161806 type:complete len:440 (+) Transcript_65718:251-1570(+)